MQRLADLPATFGILGDAFRRWLKSGLLTFVLLLGGFALILLVLAGTRVPYDAHRALGSRAGECKQPVDVLVLLGGSGMPSAAELQRLYRGAELAQAMPKAEVWVVHPGDTTVLEAMIRELLLRGVDPRRIARLNVGENTREQALAVHHVVGARNVSLGLVTAPENMYRSVRAFRKVGLANICGAPAWDHAMDHGFAYAHERIGGKAYVPDVSNATGLRYTFWNYLKLEVTCLREYVAIAYYRINGWI